MMSTTKNLDVTATGASETPEPAVGGRCSPQVSSSPVSTKSVEVLRQASTASNGAGNATAGEGVKQALSSGRKATEATAPTSLARPQAEARYAKLLDEIMAQLETLEAAVRAAPNTKLDVKTGVKAVGVGLREFANLAKKLGTVRNPDAQEQKLKMLQQLQLQQHAQTTKALNDIQEGIRQRGIGSGGADLSVEEQGARSMDIHAQLAVQSGKIDAIAEIVEKLHSTETPVWTEVVKKKAKVATKKPEEKNRKPFRTRPAAIVVDIANQDDFPELVKKIRGGVNSEVIGERVVGMRKTRSGGILLEIKGDSSDVEAVRAEVQKSTGGVNVVRTLEQRTMLEIRDLDEWTNEEDVIEAVASATGAGRETLKVISLRKAYGGSQIALVLAPTALCRNVVAHGRLRIGLVNCRVRQGVNRARCFRCLSFGHTSKDCKGPDRSKWCRRCGSQSHFAKDCNADGSEAEAFGKILEKESVAKSSANASRSANPSSR